MLLTACTKSGIIKTREKGSGKEDASESTENPGVMIEL